ncbi:MAG: fumarylacetoacetate hydrolase family protein [Polyangiaceae bacterium]|nr:fumarylacetoacetate hydrolase family protein [Polyangiaceae bacterium]
MVRRFARLQKSPHDDAYVELIAGAAHVLTAAPWVGGEPTGERLEGYDDDARGPLPRLAPVDPRKILCVGRNYRAHAKELGNEVPAEPMLFYKPTTALLDPGGSILLPPERISSRIEHEAELAVVVGARLRNADETAAARAIFGLTIACDVTARDLQKKDGQWWRAKGMDTFCPVGPVLVTGLSADALSIECTVNGDVRQAGNTRDMIFGIARVLSFVSDVMTLEPGDIVLTGTPEGVGPLVAGDRLRITVGGIGALEATVRAS